METFRLRVQLRDVRPDVVRVVDLPAAATLDEVHLMLQVALGWTDSHLHEFVVGDVHHGVVDPDGPDVEDERRTRLSDLPARWIYAYDFGDDWTHDVELLGAGGEGPGCVYGEGDCPPEDCGGAGGFDELREAIARGGTDEVVRPFDQARADRLVAQVAGRVPEPVRMVLDVVGPGVTPTPAGRLPRATVREVQARRPDWAPTTKPAQREEDLPPLAGVHEVLASTRLLRRNRGKLVPLRAAGDDREVLRRLRGWFDPGTLHGVLAELALAILLSAGDQPLEDLGTALTGLLGATVRVDGSRIDESDVYLELLRLTPALTGLGQITSRGGGWAPGPEAGWLLPRATLLGDLWAHHRSG
ncbi:plasmid pRiA4b ORF-3 family protein [Actinomycetospora sp. TBRC 11914]|uniref:plasmid pRiA4b ORF-3 family protein n=1 Tax=Actinomycetospora sp. TBRC 11914 TaxID=2729387 RepID=UPI00145EE4D2|nr:plasmid pRiA4b ORF-3 family protein [Actinomycetospora sp. TBRC 11914]NMO91910.1 plasmid pRiA4b ORF-3 family protein [Actinomycetospora sp. TBRC 11914]